MATLTASANPIIVDNTVGETQESTIITYEKDAWEELWHRTKRDGWDRPNLHVLTGLGDVADRSATYPVTLTPGDWFEVGVFEEAHGPLSTDPLPVAGLMVSCVLKEPERRDLISDSNQSTGGTFHSRHIVTRVPTIVSLIGASRTPPSIVDGLPVFDDPIGGPIVAHSSVTATDHRFELLPLVPGNQHFFSLVVIDDFGNWQVQKDTFTTHRRKLIVEFPTIHIHNDGDTFDHGAGSFTFRVLRGGPSAGNDLIQEFYMPEFDIDDWSETDRPYAAGFAHVGMLEPVDPAMPSVLVETQGTEHDGVGEANEGAWGLPRDLGLPAGQMEDVTGSTFRLDAPTSTAGDDFHYSVDVRFSVSYDP